MYIKIYMPTGIHKSNINPASAYLKRAEIEIPNTTDIFSYCQHDLEETLYSKLMIPSLSVGDVVQISNTDTYILFKGGGVKVIECPNIVENIPKSMTEQQLKHFLALTHKFEPNTEYLVNSDYNVVEIGEMSIPQFFQRMVLLVQKMQEGSVLRDDNFILAVGSFIEIEDSIFNQFKVVDYTVVTSLAQAASDEITLRDLFYTMRDHMYRQFKQSILDDNSLATTLGVTNMVNGMCLYRSSDGSKCAVGCMISDDEYSLDLESATASNVFGMLGLPSNIEKMALLNRVQRIHDQIRLYNWVEELDKIGATL